MDLKEIQNLIKFVAKAKVNEVKIERKDFKITIKSNSATKLIKPVETSQINFKEEIQDEQVDPITKSLPEVPVEEKTDYEENLITIKSPMIGTFYRKPSPEKGVFVEVGDNIKEGDVLCVIEAMKLFNEIESDVSGKVVKVLADDASPVEFEQPLFVIEKS
ncbi:MAG: acetyl-CoA carboxylase, biotin carboxyl carrier protein [Flavobacteriaceae bacterium]|nr:acetyl-CoA carboxylase, biotin carboxyl carrier protein [Flavobacteriaceae bacterium]|tara:strand:+ start:2968 stop:3450 length:483 start_codon:yes stop_codon:yes gene_type:complete